LHPNPWYHAPCLYHQSSQCVLVLRGAPFASFAARKENDKLLKYGAKEEEEEEEEEKRNRKRKRKQHPDQPHERDKEDKSRSTKETLLSRRLQISLVDP